MAIKPAARRKGYLIFNDNNMIKYKEELTYAIFMLRLRDSRDLQATASGVPSALSAGKEAHQIPATAENKLYITILRPIDHFYSLSQKELVYDKQAVLAPSVAKRRSCYSQKPDCAKEILPYKQKTRSKLYKPNRVPALFILRKASLEKIPPNLHLVKRSHYRKARIFSKKLDTIHCVVASQKEDAEI